LICTGGTLNCTRNAGVSVPVFGVSEWIFEGGIPNISTGPSVENVHFNQPGTYSIRHIFMVAGCRDTAFATVKVSAPPMVSLGRDTMLCPADTLVLSAEPYPNATYRWSTGDTITSLTVANAGTYTVTVTQASTCSASDAVEIGFLDAAAVFLGADTLICPDATIRLAAPENATAYSLRWSTGATGAEIDISAPGLYVLEMDAGNCAFSDSIIVHSADCSECRVYAANVFAPESAGPGNLFRLSPGCPVLSGRWRMYDRWGGLLFETHDPTLGWDGRLHGKVLPPGVYIYDAELQLAPLQQPVEWRRVTGSVTLIR
jgi:gliding motility-associated-like protein